MNELIDSELVRELVRAVCQRNSSRRYKSDAARTSAFMDSFDGLLRKEMSIIRKKKLQPLLDTVLTEQESDDTKETS